MSLGGSMLEFCYTSSFVVRESRTHLGRPSKVGERKGGWTSDCYGSLISVCIFITAAKMGNTSMLAKCLSYEHGRYALELDDKGYSPLMYAAQRGSLEMVGVHVVNTQSIYALQC